MKMKPVLAGTDQNSAREPTNNLTSTDNSGTSLDYIPRCYLTEWDRYSQAVLDGVCKYAHTHFPIQSRMIFTDYLNTKNQQSKKLFFSVILIIVFGA